MLEIYRLSTTYELQDTLLKNERFFFFFCISLAEEAFNKKYLTSHMNLMSKILI